MVNIIKEELPMEEQLRKISALCKFKGYKIYDYYTDAEISAKQTIIDQSLID